MPTVVRKKPADKSRTVAAADAAIGVGAYPAVAVSAAQLRTRLRMSQPVFARLLAVSTRSVANLEAGVAPTEALARRLTELDRLITALSEVVAAELLGDWLQRPNPAFDGLKPLEVVERGESDRLWAMVYFLRSGVSA